MIGAAGMKEFGPIVHRRERRLELLGLKQPQRSQPLSVR